jgi:hypothetical protein
MKRLCGVLACAVAAIGLVAGCEWESSSDGNSWSDSYNWVNFSGTYRNASGGILVSAYTQSSGTTTTTTTTSTGETSTKTNSTSTVKTSTKESGGTLAAKALEASGSTSHKPVVPGSVVIQIGDDVSLADDGNGALAGSGGSGTVSYESGAWTFSLQTTQWSELSRKITVSYSYTTTSSTDDGKQDTSTDEGSKTTTTTTTQPTTKAGSSGKAIYSFVVAQQGQHLTITDNNGAQYTGRLGELRSTSGATSGNSKSTAEGGKVLPKDGDTIVATFNCKGTSAAGMSVTITGTFQGTVAASVFTGRTMQGTWIEAGGKTGDINGTANSVAITTTPATTDETTTDTES